MTTHTGAHLETQFNNDYNNLQTAAEQYAADLSQAQAYKTAYNEQWLAITSGSKAANNPWSELILIMALISNQGSNQLNEQLATQGDQLQCQTTIGALNNDIENMTNDTQVTNTAGGAQNATALVQFTASALDKVLYALNPAIPNPAGSQNWYTDLQNALTSQGAAPLITNFATLRSYIYTGQADGYDPASATAGNFDTTGNPATKATCFDSFAQMHKDAASQSNARGASQMLTNLSTQFNTNTSMLQSTQASSNQQISETTNSIKTMESAVSNFGHSLMSVVQTATQNMSK